MAPLKKTSTENLCRIRNFFLRILKVFSWGAQVCEQEDAELGPVLTVGVADADEADTHQSQGQGIILNDLQAFYAGNEKVAADIDQQLSSIIENLTKARLPDDKLKAK